MTDRSFSREYAELYDLLYRDKDYEAECDILEDVFQRYGVHPIRTVLDLGCGTGGHAFPLARRGYRVTGVDRSAEMLAQARKKSGAEAPNAGYGLPVFTPGDVRSLALGQEFDAVLMMFAVLGYQTTNNDVLGTLGTVRRHLKPGRIFAGDLWYGPAVLAIRPSDRVKVLPTEDGQVIRLASGTLDTYRHIAEVRYRFWRLRGREVLGEGEETHQMRFFFPQELAFFMAQAGMELLDIRAFSPALPPASDSTWNVLAVARAI